ncbi:MAG TPA: vitamin B12-dependent ribonucleotide reductase [Actinomycetes bacterium]|nr:vitamin B12-dependent ribonucleotide reductase [Actinomycetes bacterium]
MAKTRDALSVENGPARRGGLKVGRLFTTKGTHPYDELTWERRDAVITNWRDGTTAFEQRDLEFPSTWSQNATNIVAQKYFRGPLGTPQREHSVRQMVDRVAGTITRWGAKDGYFASDDDASAFQAELTHLLVNQKAAFNSPVWFNVGVEPEPQCSACQPYDALVSTPTGMVPIGELVERRAVGTVVYDAHGETRIRAVKANGDKRVYRVLLRNGSFVEATADHLVYAVSERRAVGSWLRVDQLRPGMRLHLYPHRGSAEDLVSPLAATERQAEVGGGTATLVRTEPATREASEAALAGWLQADGFVGQYATGTNTSLTIEFQTVTEEEHNWVQQHLQVVFPDVHRHVRTFETADATLTGRRTRLYGEVLRPFVESWGLLARRHDLRVPARLWNGSNEAVAAYLRSIFQADGYVTVQGGSGRVAFAVISERWTEDIQVLLLRLGIYSRRLRKAEPRPDRSDLFEVQINVRSERAAFRSKVGFLSAGKAGTLDASLDLDGKVCGSLREEEIVAIEDRGVQPVFDIQTDSGEYLSNNVRVHNCFILSVSDTMPSILNWYVEEGMIFKGGSGSGINLSTIRSSREQLGNGGEASGPVSFMRGADASAGTIKSGGKTRRAAKMVVLNVDHPDVRDFIWCKAREEHKARVLRDAGFDMDLDGRDSISIQYQNANNSVRVTDEFMHAYEADASFDLKAVLNGSAMETLPARDLMREIAQAAWECADPGMQYDTTINDWHTTPESGRINASNPCSEYMHLDNSACNLASLNLLRFLDADGHFDVTAFRHAVEIVFLAQEIIVGNSSYPTERITQNARDFRQLGLGYANLGALLMALGKAYDSDGGRAWAGSITALMTGHAYRTSARIAQVTGPFAGYPKNREPMLRVMGKHRAAVDEIDAGLVQPDLFEAARTAWDEAIELGTEHGYRNAQASVLAPTGTIGLLMDCDTTGIEPDLALVKTKKLVGGGSMSIVNQTVPRALRTLGYADEHVQAITEYVAENNSVKGAPALRAEHYPVFDCAMGDSPIHYMGHIRMMAAAQPFLSGAISKTVNMPEDVTVEDVERAYVEGWKLGLKALAIYRDNCKVGQPLSADKKVTTDTGAVIEVDSAPVRRRLPKQRPSKTTSFRVGDIEGYLTAGSYPDDGLGEIFVNVSKQGSTLSGVMDAFSIAVSVGLQYGVPLEALVSKFTNMIFEPNGMTDDPDIRIAQSLVDYLARRLAIDFLDVETRHALGIKTTAERTAEVNGTAEPSTSAEPAVAGGSAQPGGSAQAGGSGSAPVPVEFQQRPAAPAGSAGGSAGSVGSAGGSSAPVAAQAPAFTPGMAAVDAPYCSTCGVRMRPAGSCFVCESCGTTSGCS